MATSDAAPAAATVTTDPAASDAAAAAAATAAAEAGAADAAAPTAGADVAMWNAAPEKAEPAADESAAARLGRVVNVKKFATGIAERGMAIATTLTKNAMKFLGVPYVFGGESIHGFDCSGYVQHVFAMVGIHLPRTADAQYAVARKIAGKPIRGDLVFFQTYAPGPSHVGIALGGDRFVHASGHGVMVSSLHDSYWASRYLGAKRVFE